jgi:hypothetical protein
VILLSAAVSTAPRTTGSLVGDGELAHPRAEDILEAYNRDRGPVVIGALRVHAQF